ncbi:MAG: exodeoxyribonuclease III [Myxococcales bacterium]|nr:exodeoxyribonuclease III [Myxococcales bacterium]MCB9715846.1 exodeoxyribonuclease III [Myxococcales bacterium]
MRPVATDELRVLSWNVNGLRACDRAGFRRQLRRLRPDVIGVQEVRALPEQLEPGLRRPRNWHTSFVAAERKGYSGVGLYSRRAPDEVETSVGQERFDREGRVQLARFGRLLVANVYFPNGNGKDRDNGRVPYKLEFYRHLFELLQARRRAGLRVLVMGDFNTAHQEIDLARPKQNTKTSGFLPEERQELARWLGAGWVDTFRAFEPGGGHYSWWSQRMGARERNIGWRIDYVLASSAAMGFVRGAFIHPEVTGSDHCPVGVSLDPAVLG